MSLLNSLNNVAGALTNVDNALQGLNSPQDFSKEGFIVPPIPGGSGNSLPSQSIPSMKKGVSQRNIGHWFVPEVGVINMYINPQSIVYNEKKLISHERTKGGYLINYFGEELMTLDISGNTGSSGIEGINVLREIYRAEQYLFDPIALTMAADNSVTGVNDLIDSAMGNLGSLGGALGGAASGLLGLDPTSQNVLPRNIPSLASIATGLEFYYAGVVHRGYFTSFSFTESATNFLFEYKIGFTVTQRRGYRINGFPFAKSAIDGPSSSAIPYSYIGLQKNSTLTPNQASLTTGKGPFSE